ncbi:MAG: hypothetical protein IKL10_05635 [Clostridia bacterium]|nr:hypothetical protein [Clostridia bacterium]
MSDSLKSQLNTYYKDISSSLLCKNGKKRIFIRELKSNISDFVENNPDATIEDIMNCFGKPAEIAESFKAETDILTLRKKLSVKKLIIIALSAALLIYLAFVIISLIDVHTEAHGYFQEHILYINNVILKGGSL